MLNALKENLKQQVRLALHRGNKYTCPFCGYKSKDLSPAGFDFPVLKEKHVIGGGRRAAGCYNCGSIDRERLVYIYLKEKLRIFDKNKSLRILHIAPEKHLSRKMLDFGFTEYICGDLFAEGYQYPAHVQNINVLNIPFPDNYFDLVICNHVLEHIPNDADAMKEIFRVLKAGGKAVLQVPISKIAATTYEDFSITNPKERERVFGQFDHLRIYGQDYVQRLEKNGFKVTRINISEEFKQYGLNPEEDIFIGNK